MSEYRFLSELSAVVNEKVDGRKDPAFRYVGLEHFDSGSSYLNGCSAAHVSISTNSVFKAGDTLFGKLRPNLRKSVLAPFNGYCSTDILVLRPAEDVLPEYASRVFQSEDVFRYAEKTAVGTKMPRTSWVHLKQLQVFCPSRGDQEVIADILDTIDTQIQKTEAIIAKLQKVKLGLLHDLLTRGVDAKGQLRPPREQAPELYKESPLGWIPKEWEVICLGDVATRSAGVLQTGPFGAQLHAHEYVSEGVPVVMPQDLNDETIDTTKIAHITESRACSLGRHRVIKNDVVFSRRGDLSRCVAITENESGWVCGTGCLLARFTEDEIIGQWLSLSYKQQCSQSQIEGMAVGSTMPNLNTGILSKLLIARPTAVEQRAILTLYESSSDRYIMEQKALAKLMKQKTGLMDDLLTGRVHVNHLTS